ncbi:MAG: hypothetical protein DWQ36_01475 [Acidobacteria bacterium]|nr:MAG: hypothetical protein DWQ30_14265 [Acidobacteriota bacterium]REK11682.1 MAG: hypothetical protein DWQ36_01475 [Acidobacteriota bacterium]
MLFVMLVTVWTVAAPLAAQPPDLDVRAVAAKVAPDLLADLRADVAASDEKADGELPAYRIVVSLRPVEEAASLARAFSSPALEERLRANVEAKQAAVIAGVRAAAPGGFALLNRYRSIYGFSALADAAGVVALAAHDEVAFVEKMPVYYKQDAQAFPLTNTDLAHAAGARGAGVTIAIIDDGIDHDHPAFGGQSAYPNSKILGGRDFADNDNDPRIDCTAQSHGTSVAGVAAGNGGGVVGTAPDATIVFLKIQSASICGQNALDGDIPGAIDWAVTNRNTYGIKVISMSLGTSSTFTNPCSGIAEASALNAASNAGMVTLIASGNSAASNGISSPACHPAAVSVGAVYDANIGGANFGICNDSTTFADKVTCYSNSDTFLDLLAPSHCAFTASAGGGTTSCFGGTSSATPYAAGITATLFGEDSGLSRSAAIAALTSTGVPVTDARNGLTKPRVDHQAAVDEVGGGGGGGGPCQGCIDFSSTPLVAYSNQDTSNGSVTVQDGGATLAMVGNRWRRTTQTFTVTANTVIEFDFSSTSQGEIHGIGFDEDDNLTNAQRIFQIHGTQNWSGGIQNAVQYGGGTQTFTIAVGDFYTGSNMRLVFVNDKDSGSQTNTSNFTDVRIFEDGGGGGGGCSLDDDFESGASGWSNSGSSTCSTGAYVLGTPSQQSNGGVVTQVGGDHTTGSGNAIYTASNSSAGNADVDGGNCVLESPTWPVSEASELSVWYFHGQRDTGDDPSGDFFRLEISTNGGASYTPLVSIGDVRTQAVWTEATRSIAAGSNVKLRLQVSDGAGPGDLIEGGIDDLSICSQ